MFHEIQRKASVYAAMASIIPKIYLAYSLWFWVSLVLNVIATTIFVFFWRAVYANTDSIAGLDLQQTLNYILLAQIFAPLGNLMLIFEFGYGLREGGIAHALLRPVDFQGSYYGQYLTSMVTELVLQVPLALVVTLVFKVQWPTDPRVWAAFTVSAFLGRTVLFFFDWILACLTFYTTEVWGLGVFIDGISMFFSGRLIPLTMLPGLLLVIAGMTPFAQAFYIPVSILSGVTPLSHAPRLWLLQAIWLVCLWVLSRLIFRFAVRKVTVQGG
jgi:ABC-2 type transport system permease protein